MSVSALADSMSAAASLHAADVDETSTSHLFVKHRVQRSSIRKSALNFEREARETVQGKNGRVAKIESSRWLLRALSPITETVEKTLETREVL